MILKEQEEKKVYSDGEAIERSMLDIAKKYPEDLSQEYISNNSKYTINNTFSSVRRNILNWYPFKKDCNILEIGAGMGAVTGLFCDVAKHVTAIEMSEKRADVIRARYAGRDNLEVISQNIDEWETEEKFDYVVFIGVLEYAAVFSDSDNPFVEFIKNAEKFLKEDGILLFAIENRFGLKYWAGASEDHLQKPFVGIEGYREPKTPRTFSKAELSEILCASGLRNFRFYNVFPDYKFPTVISVEGNHPSYMNLKNVSYTYSKNSSMLFDEKNIYKDLIENDTLDFFANSYLVEASRKKLSNEYVLYVSARGEAKQEYRVSTVIYNTGDVRKIPVHRKAKRHILNILENHRKLKQQGIQILDICRRGDELHCSFHKGIEAQNYFVQLLKENRVKELFEFLDTFKGEILRSSDISKNGINIIDVAGLREQPREYDGIVLENGYIDMTLYNAFYESGSFVFFDQEWCFADVPADFILYYAIKSAYLRMEVKTNISLSEILEKYGLENRKQLFDSLEEYVWSTVLYRQTDFYGEDGYCNRFNEEMLVTKQLIALSDKIEDDERQLNEQKVKLENAIRESEEKESKINLLSAECNNKSGHIEQLLQSERDLKNEANNKKAHIEQLLQSERDLKAQLKLLHDSHAFRLMQVLWKINAKLLPVESRRRKILRRIIHPFGNGKSALNYEGGNNGVGIEENKTKHIEDYEKLNFVKFNDKTVSIVIPVYNEFEYTYECLCSILKNSGDVTYEVIIADDCSTDLTTKISEIISGITVIRTEENLRFLRNCNNAAKYACGKYILFLNNDTQVRENWLQPLVDLCEEHEDIGMVGSKLVYPDGSLQEAGGILWRDGSAWNYGNRQDALKPEFNYVKDVDYISGAAIMLRSELWKEIGGFDERFAPAYCEDSDLAFEVRKHGYRVVYQPLSVVVHFEGVSNGTDLNNGVKRYQVENSQKLYQKWNGELERHYVNAEHVFRARERSFDKKIVLFIDHYVPHFDEDAGSKTIYQYLKMFLQKGYQVKFVGDNFYQHEPYTTILQQMGIEVLYGSYYAEHIFDWLRENKEEIDFVFLNRPHISIKYIDFIREKTDIKIIYYGHDLHFVRNRREYELTGDKQKMKESDDWLEKELYLMRHADVSYYPSVVEKEEIQKIDAAIPVKAITAYVYDNFKEDIQYNFNQREGILFVGGFRHDPNLDAVKWFTERIFPVIRNKIEVPFYIVGSHAPDSVMSLNGKNGIIVKGFVSDEELEKLYESCRIVVVPLRYGAGVKGKVVEAIYNGTPIVTTSVGAEGICDSEDVLIVEDDAEKFAESVVSLYNDEKRLRELAEATQKYIRNYFSTDAVWKIIEEDF